MEERVSFSVSYITERRKDYITKIEIITHSIEISTVTLRFDFNKTMPWQKEEDADFYIKIVEDEQTLLCNCGPCFGIGDSSEAHRKDFTLVREEENANVNGKLYMSCVEKGFKNLGFERVKSNKMDPDFYTFVRRKK